MSVSRKARSVPRRFLGAFKKGHRYSTREMIDEELSWELLYRIERSNYTDLEAIEALEYITKFNNEFHKNVIKKGDPKALHSTDELRRDLYSRENAKNRDIMSVNNRTELDHVSNDQVDTSYNGKLNDDMDTLSSDNFYVR